MPLGVSTVSDRFRGLKSATSNQKGVWIGIFQPNQKILKITISLSQIKPDHYATGREDVTHQQWRRERPKVGKDNSKMADVRHLGNTLCLKKTVQHCFAMNFVKFPPILIIFGRKMAKRLKLCEVHSFSTSLNSGQHTTVLNADVPDCYTRL